MAEPLSSDIIVDTDEPDAVTLDEAGNPEVRLDDGSVVIDLNPQPEDDKDSTFDENLALRIPASELATLATELLDGIDADIQSRSEWEATRTRGIELLGLKLEQPGGDTGASSAPLEGMSTVRHPLLLEAVLRAQANASGELLPASGPVKIRDDGEETKEQDELAEAFEKDFNHYLTVVATEYYPDTKRALFWSSFGGAHFKKVYHCPLKRRPTSEGVDANDIIVSNAATDLANCGRLTHRISMRPSTLKRMMLLGVYRDVTLTQPQPAPNQVDQKKETIEGIRSLQTRPEDQPYTLYECYCECDLDQFAPKPFKGKAIPLPYRVTIDKDSREILEIRRNWSEDDEQCMPAKFLVKYPYVEGMGLYGIGLVHILGNLTNVLTAAVREALDAGMFANFPGNLTLKSATRQLTNEMRIPPGGSYAIDAPTGNIRDAVMPLPYKDVTPGLMTLIDKITETGQRLGGTADTPVGEGRQDAPVGTTLAMIEQATKIESAVHKGLHQAQSEEFQLLKERFREDPEAFWRHNKKCTTTWDKDKLMKALDDCNLVPVADPNTPSHMHRIAKALAIKQLQAANPALYNAKAVDERVLRMIKVDDPQSLFAAPQAAPGPDPMVTAQLALAKEKLDIDKSKIAVASSDKAAERQSKENIAVLNLAKELAVHPESQGVVQQTIAEHGPVAADKDPKDPAGS